MPMHFLLRMETWRRSRHFVLIPRTADGEASLDLDEVIDGPRWTELWGEVMIQTVPAAARGRGVDDPREPRGDVVEVDQDVVASAAATGLKE
ncbi:hypothetical protein O9K51_00267 [Purpureocillium lavendulum]|uniref:Uncharacterized protein n=1 Tax=Purpureocillium lavendulum TaxID=1247861 RepID=A0AB34G3V3_9HYPO|nr:hypothetical protein O9K51_00267 [Purpureocillium lavendulum]